MKISNENIAAIALFSGGLDSILACRVIGRQGINVHALKFVTPFFEYDLLGRAKEYQLEIMEKYEIDVTLIDISSEYLEMLKSPPHGYGKHFNPCIDCKIMMVSKAKALLKEFNASFLITGEVIGQRPMSQRRDTLRVIERDSGCNRTKDGKNGNSAAGEGILLRPLCARNMEPTKPELDGIVDREQLYGFSGRSRSDQMRLASEFGIHDYPTPAGGCVLTDPNLGRRIKKFYSTHKQIMVEDMKLITVGRQFWLPGGGWLVMGRDESENQKVLDCFTKSDMLLKLEDRPGPTAILRYMADKDDLKLAAGLVARYGKKDINGNVVGGPVICLAETSEIVIGEPPEDSFSKKLLF